jgi:hypothetical protein
MPRMPMPNAARVVRQSIKIAQRMGLTESAAAEVVYTAAVSAQYVARGHCARDTDWLDKIVNLAGEHSRWLTGRKPLSDA